MVPARSKWPVLVESRHLRGLAAGERPSRARGNRARRPRRSPRCPRIAEPRPGDVVHERERARAVDQDVVHAVVDQVLAHGVVAGRPAARRAPWCPRRRCSSPASASASRRAPGPCRRRRRSGRRPAPSGCPRPAGRCAALAGFGVARSTPAAAYWRLGHADSGIRAARATWVRSWKARTRCSTSHAW